MIAAEKLVCALARQNDLYLLRSEICEKIQRYCRGVRERFIHIILNHGSNIKVLLGGYLFGKILDVFVLCKFLSMRELGIFFLRVAYGKGLYIIALCHFVNDIARIYTA